jgi:hypothetical protein
MLEIAGQVSLSTVMFFTEKSKYGHLKYSDLKHLDPSFRQGVPFADTVRKLENDSGFSASRTDKTKVRLE